MAVEIVLVSLKTLLSHRLAQVPVYLGAPEAAQLLPPGSFIDASAFKTGAELGEGGS